MRTTVTIDDHLLAEAKVLAARSHRTLGSVVEDGLRRLLRDENEGSRPDEPHRLATFHPEIPGLLPGVDLEDKEQIADLLGDNDWPPPR